MALNMVTALMSQSSTNKMSSKFIYSITVMVYLLIKWKICLRPLNGLKAQEIETLGDWD